MTTLLSFLFVAFLLLPFMWRGWCAWQLFKVICTAITWRVLTVVIWVWKLVLRLRKSEEVENESKPSLHVGDNLGWQ